ncbi:MAG: EamA family transporter [Clostridiales bacterium]|nr:EamA family transporter [Clostridiales bacterium]
MKSSSCLLYLFSVFIAAFSQILLKKQANNHYESFIRKFLNVRVIVAYALLFVSLVLNSIALGDMNISLVPYITATSFFWVMILSFFFLHEKPGSRKIIGVIIIFVGIIVSRISI